MIRDIQENSIKRYWKKNEAWGVDSLLNFRQTSKKIYNMSMKLQDLVDISSEAMHKGIRILSLQIFTYADIRKVLGGFEKQLWSTLRLRIAIIDAIARIYVFSRRCSTHDDGLYVIEELYIYIYI